MLRKATLLSSPSQPWRAPRSLQHRLRPGVGMTDGADFIASGTAGPSDTIIRSLLAILSLTARAATDRTTRRAAHSLGMMVSAISAPKPAAKIEGRPARPSHSDWTTPSLQLVSW